MYMQSNNVIFKKATVRHAIEFYGEDAKIKSFKGYVAMMGGAVVGISGLYYSGGNMVLFSDMKDEFRPYKKDIVKAIRLIRDFIKNTKHPIYAVSQCGEILSSKILLKLGFVNSGSGSPDGDIYIRRP